MGSKFWLRNCVTYRRIMQYILVKKVYGLQARSACVPKRIIHAPALIQTKIFLHLTINLTDLSRIIISPTC